MKLESRTSRDTTDQDMARATKYRTKTTNDQDQLVSREHLPTLISVKICQNVSCQKAIQKISMRELAADASTLRVVIRACAIAPSLFFYRASQTDDPELIA